MSPSPSAALGLTCGRTAGGIAALLGILPIRKLRVTKHVEKRVEKKGEKKEETKAESVEAAAGTVAGPALDPTAPRAK